MVCILVNVTNMHRCYWRAKRAQSITWIGRFYISDAVINKIFHFWRSPIENGARFESIKDGNTHYSQRWCWANTTVCLLTPKTSERGRRQFWICRWVWPTPVAAGTRVRTPLWPSIQTSIPPCFSGLLPSGSASMTRGLAEPVRGYGTNMLVIGGTLVATQQ